MAAPDSDFSSALTTWKEVNLSALQKSLDASGLEIVENQKENQVGRKRLAEQTREFKKISDEEKMNSFKGLLKAYQSEIDALTKRSKTAESAFLNVYKLLAEAPDPYPLLDAAVDQTVRASEAKLLELELARSKDEVAQLKKDLAQAQDKDKERKKQQERADKLEAKMEEMVKASVTSKEAELNALYAERIANFQDRERDLTKQVELSRSQLRDLRTSNDSTQARLLDNSSKRDLESAARQAESDMVQADLERAQRRVTEMEQRNEKLRVEIEAVRTGSESQERIKALDIQIGEMQAEAQRLLDALEAQKEAANSEKKASQKSQEQMNKRLAAAEAEAQELKVKVAQLSDYDDIKRELEIMKYVEFTSMNLDEDDDVLGSEDASTLSSSLRLPDPNADKANRAGGTRSLENLLMSKNRKLQDDLTTLRVAHDELQISSRKMGIEADKAQAELTKLEVLNEKLEEDLARMQLGGAAPGSASGTMPGSVSPLPRPDPLTTLGALSSRSIDPLAPSSSPAPTNDPLTKSSAETSILPIITSQRDRFRQRNAELEEELRKQFDTITETRNEMKALQADNLKLYEKVRYLQSYGSEPGKSASRVGVPSAVARKDEELGKYRGIYEEHMNPFDKFRGRERLGALQALNPFDKLILHASNFVLGNRVARNLFVLYACTIHILLFLTFGESAVAGEGAGGASGAISPVGGVGDT